MGLSQWVLVGWTEDLQSTKPQMITRNGYVLEVYKDWVYVKKPNDEYAFFTIHEGRFDFDGVSIIAKHVYKPTSAVLVGFSKYYPKEGKPTEKLFAIGCYGFDKSHPNADENDWVGLQDGHINALREMLSTDEETAIIDFEKAPTLEKFKENMNVRNLSTAKLGWSLRDYKF